MTTERQQLHLEDDPLYPEVTVVGPEYLEKGQNYFDQEPFKSLIPRIAKSTQIDEEMWKAYLTQYARTYAHMYGAYSNDPQRILDPEQRNSLFNMASINFNQCLKNTFKKGKKADRIVVDQINPFVPGAIAELSRYPYWAEYIDSEFPFPMYRANGDFQANRQVFPSSVHVPVRSYGKWITEQNKAFRNQAVFGIREIFVQDVGGESVQSAIHSASGEQIARKHTWIIRHAAEIPPKPQPKTH